MTKKRRDEYGGYLGLELQFKKEYYDYIPSTDILKVNCGRTAFYCSLIHSKIRKVYCPYYTCERTIDPIKMTGVDIEFYFLNDDLTPKNINPRDDEAVLWVNYYGNATEDVKKCISRQFSTLIIDNCQAFFSEPITNAYNCYSSRKFFGVADGGYVIYKGIKSIEDKIPNSYSSDDSNFLLKTIELGTNAVYPLNIYNESRLNNNIAKMSPITQRILASIDYEYVRTKRYQNLMKLHSNLKHINKFSVNIESKTLMYYPLLVENAHLRDRLIKNHIYTPTWWRHVPELSNYARLETWLSQYMVFLPIDQRYDIDDMDNISEIVLDLLR